MGLSRGIWHELDASAFCYGQAISRLHWIGQECPVSILLSCYAGTGQEVLFDQADRKVSASLEVDGLAMRASLDATVAGAALPHGFAAALSLGRAVYRGLSRAA